MIKKLLTSLIISMAFVMFAASSIHASEGQYNINNVVGGPGRCFGYSVLMSDFTYQLLMSCRDLKYPISSGAFQYGAWARTADSQRPTYLGDLGVGKRLFEVEGSFTEIFVTEELSRSPRQPSDSIIMRGFVEPIPLLDNPGIAPSPTPVVSPVPQQNTDSGLGAFGNDAPEGQSDTRASAFTALRIVGGIIVVVVLIVIVIALVSAMRRKPIDL